MFYKPGCMCLEGKKKKNMIKNCLTQHIIEILYVVSLCQ